MVNMKPMPDSPPTLQEEIEQDLKQEGSSNDMLENSFVGSDMVDSLEDGVPGYETEGESGKLVGEGVPGYQTTGEPEPNDDIQNQSDETIEQEEGFNPSPSPFK